jgi:hypothetical protein
VTAIQPAPITVATVAGRGRAGKEGGDPVAHQERDTERHGVGAWIRTRWLILTLVAIAIAVGIVLIVLYAGDGGGGVGY